MMERRLTAEMRLSPGTLLVVAAVAGLLVRLYLAFTSIGTSDVVFKLYYGTMTGKYSVLYVYNYVDFVNHPPLSLVLMDWYLRIASVTALEFPVVFRVVQSVADVVTATAIYQFGRNTLSRQAAIAFLLCPAAIVVSGFHCNTDPMMLALLALGFLAARHDRFLLAGALLGASFGIKIVAIFAVPLFLLVAGKRLWHVAAGFLLIVILLFAPTLLVGGPAVLENVLGYSGWRSIWGIAGLTEWIHRFVARGPVRTPWLAISEAYSAHGNLVLGAALLLFYGLFWRGLRQGRQAMDLLAESVPVVYLIVLGLAPRFGVQYLTWPLPFLPYALKRGLYVTTCLVFSAYLFAAYTIWSGGFPWWFADAMTENPIKWILTDTGFLVWAWIVVVAIAGIRRVRAPLPAA